MRLINVHTFELEEFFGTDIPEYVILSHTWARGEEVTFQEWNAVLYGAVDISSISWKSGFHKILAACQKTKEFECGYLWVDTNCIDKTSSAELSEAINSMYTWYQRSSACIAYLGDASVGCFNSENGYYQVGEDFELSKWFTRGWTLQELLAPRQLCFYSNDWKCIGSKRSLSSRIERITQISAIYLHDTRRIREAPIGVKMAWAAPRFTTREEDVAYCLMGILGICMPLLYGEGKRAFIRLQEELIRRTNDSTIFCWVLEEQDEMWPEAPSILAPSPRNFQYCSKVKALHKLDWRLSSFSMTNSGLLLRLPLIQGYSSYYAVLEVAKEAKTAGSQYPFCIPVEGDFEKGAIGRSRVPANPIAMSRSWTLLVDDFYFPAETKPWNRSAPDETVHAEYGILLTFSLRRTDQYPLVQPMDVSMMSTDTTLCWPWSSEVFDRYRGIVGLQQETADSEHLAARFGILLVLTLAPCQEVLVWFGVEESGSNSSSYSFSHYVFPFIGGIWQSLDYLRQLWREFRSTKGLQRAIYTSKNANAEVSLEVGPVCSTNEIEHLVPVHFKLPTPSSGGKDLPTDMKVESRYIECAALAAQQMLCLEPGGGRLYA